MERREEFFECLAGVGRANIVLEGASARADIFGLPVLGADASDVVVRTGDCDCHVHIRWEEIKRIEVIERDHQLGRGMETLLRFVSLADQVMLTFYYPPGSKPSLLKLVGSWLTQNR